MPLAAWALPEDGVASPGDLPTADPAADIADYGTDSALDALADGCEAGALQDCDDLYDMAPGDSLFFDSDVPHGPEELIGLPVRTLSLIVQPRDED